MPEGWNPQYNKKASWPEIQGLHLIMYQWSVSQTSGVGQAAQEVLLYPSQNSDHTLKAAADAVAAAFVHESKTPSVAYVSITYL